MPRILFALLIVLILALPVAAQTTPAPATPASGSIQFYPRTSLHFLGDASYAIEPQGEQIAVSVNHGDKQQSYRLSGELLEIDRIPLDQGTEVLVVVYNKRGAEKWVLVLAEIDFIKYMREAARAKGVSAEIDLAGQAQIASLQVSDAGFRQILGMPAE
ncbi:MAG: hypothetical protein P9M14_03265 [Candidatus Alcyoniella australis]|nr:hypothetical protein [Candidatus Alcyoniella australis]